MKHLTTILLALALTACAGITQYFDALASVELGDSYEVMVDKMGFEPPEWRCYTSEGFEVCRATYLLQGERASTFWFKDSKIASISI